MARRRNDEGVRKLMLPGRLTRDGLLGTDARPLEEIIASDEAELGRLGRSRAAVAGRMRELRELGSRALGDSVAAGRREVCSESARGSLCCPFGDSGDIPKAWVIVRDVPTGEELIFTELNIHMIERHGFFEGRGAAFRLEPEKLVRLLEVPAEKEPRSSGGARKPRGRGRGNKSR